MFFNFVIYFCFHIRCSSIIASQKNYPFMKHHHASSRVITRPHLRYVTPDTNNPLYYLFIFLLKLKKKVTHPPTTHFSS